MHISFPQAVATVSSIVLQAVILRVMAKRNLKSSFPFFFSFVAFMTVGIVLGLGVFFFASQQYFNFYWTFNTISMLIGFMVLYEVFVSILKPFSAVIDLGKMLFVWAGLFLLLAGFLTAAVTSGPHTNRLVVAVDLCDRCVHLMQCGMLMLLMFFEKRLNLSWRSHAMSIGLGIGITAAVDLGVSYGQSRFPALHSQLDVVYGFSYAAVVAFWAYTLMSKQPARSTAAESPTRLILQRWNEALTGYGYGDVAYASNATDSFLPNVERTVDRVMARKIVK
jgi:hypothetical protein